MLIIISWQYEPGLLILHCVCVCAWGWHRCMYMYIQYIQHLPILYRSMHRSERRSHCSKGQRCDSWHCKWQIPAYISASGLDKCGDWKHPPLTYYTLIRKKPNLLIWKRGGWSPRKAENEDTPVTVESYTPVKRTNSTTFYYCSLISCHTVSLSFLVFYLKK